MTLPSSSVDTLRSNPSPVVTVLMAVFNTETHLREAIESILNQTFKDLEFLIYNDGSSDGTADIVRSYSDPRIVFIDYTSNRGVSLNMNEGIAKARGRYIARMDGDDVAYPERLALQVAYLEAHPEVGLCGAAVRYIGASDTVVHLPEANEIIQHTLWLRNAFYQPVVVIRTSVLIGHNLRYDTRYDPAEDYKLWSDMSGVTELHNLPQVLLDYRIHPHQISRRQSSKQQNNIDRIRREQMARVGIELLPEHEGAFTLLTREDSWATLGMSDYAQIGELLDSFNQQVGKLALAPAVVEEALGQEWMRMLGSARQFGPKMLPYILRQPFRRYFPASTLVKLVAKCLIGWQPRGLVSAA